MSSRRGIARSAGAVITVAVTALLGGCATVPPAPRPVAIETADAMAARSLDNEGLRDFLRQNLGHEPSGWDFETLCWVAFHYHPSLAVARARWAAAQAEYVTAAARPNPVVGIVPGFSSNAPGGTSPWFPAINLDFLLETGDKRARRSEAGRQRAEAARLEVAAAAWQVRSELRGALLDWQYAEKHAALAAQAVRLQQQLANLLQQRLDLGAITGPEAAVARQAVLRAEAIAADTAGQVTPARNRVAAALGLPLSALDGIALGEVPAAPAMTDEALAQARRLALQNRSDVLASLATYAAAATDLRLALAGRHPDVHLGPGFQWDQGQDKWSLGLSFELPVFNHQEGPIALAVARVQEAAAQVTASQAKAIAAIDGAVAAHAAAVERERQLGVLHASAERLRQLTEDRLRAGAADQVEVLDARLNLVADEIALADAAAATARTAGEIEDALEVPFPHLDSLLAPPAPAAHPISP
ncbi:MAG TPA: TolC family protein [Lacunisphaera sp.]|nr:TolC family protein [Lacunisphaera sp.]